LLSELKTSACGKEGLKDTIVVEAIYRSVAAGQRVKIG